MLMKVADTSVPKKSSLNIPLLYIRIVIIIIIGLLYPKPVSVHNQAPMNTYDLRIKWAMEVYLFGENADLSV